MFDQLLKAAYHYYVLNDPIMSDAEYDELYQKCKELEKDLPENQKITNKVCLGYFEGINRPKVKHIIPMLSLEKRDKAIFPVIQTPKFDGVAIEVVYRYGIKHVVLTRGDGEYGGDITKHNIQNIPSYIDLWKNLEWVIVRGEAMWDNYIGKTHRNAVAGKLNSLEICSDIYMIAYFLYKCKNNDINVENHLLELKELGFLITPYRVYKEPTEIDYSSLSDHPTDGFVFRLLYSGDDLSHTGHHYKHSWAWKPAAKEVKTTIVGVMWNQSKNNAWTPVAIIDPVDIDGTTISKINLMSLDYINERDIAIGDVVLVRKAKDIIPEISSVEYRPPSRQVIQLTNCPNCGEKLIREGIYLKCQVKNCAYIKELSHFCKTLDIKGLSDKTLEILDIRFPYELYSMSEELLVTKLGKRGSTIYKELQKSKNSPLEKLIAALNPPLIKETTLKKIFQYITNWEDLGNYDKLLSIKGIGETKAKALSDWFKEKYSILKIFLNIGFNFNIGNVLHSYNKTICISGTLKNMSRSEFKDLMEKYNIKVIDYISKETKLLVIGDNPSMQKIEKAKNNNILIVSVDHFLNDLLREV